MRLPRLYRLFPVLPALAAWGLPMPARAEPFDPRLGAPFERRERASLGSDKAPIAVVEFASYTCSHCQAFLKRVFPKLKLRYVDTGEVQWFMVASSANPADQNSRIFEVGRCLQREGKFWDALDFLMHIGPRPAKSVDDLVAQNPAVASDDMAICLKDAETRILVQKDFSEYHQFKIVGTPTFFIRRFRADGAHTDTTVPGYRDADYLGRVFDTLLKRP